MLATGNTQAPGVWDPNQDADIKGHLDLTCFMESLSQEAGTYGMQSPPGLAASMGPPPNAPPGLDTTIDVPQILGSLSTYLSKRTLFFHDETIGQESKGLPLSPTSTGIPSEEDSTEEDASLPSPSSYAYSNALPRQVPIEAQEALHKLTELVAEENLRREDLVTNEVTAQLYPFIPYDDEGNVTSLGSILHAHGGCKPCAFWKRDRCHKKDLCLFCHFEHDIPKPACSRKSKSRRMRLARHKNNQQDQSEAMVQYFV